MTATLRRRASTFGSSARVHGSRLARAASVLFQAPGADLAYGRGPSEWERVENDYYRSLKNRGSADRG
jgi:hypothetical protein